MAQNILYKGKNKIVQNQPQTPPTPAPNQPPTQEEMLKYAATQQAITGNPAGSALSPMPTGNLGQTVAKGVLQQQYVPAENLAATVQAQGTFGQQGDTFGNPELIRPPTDKNILGGLASKGEPIIHNWGEIKAAAIGLIEGLGVHIRHFSVAAGTDPVSTSNKVMKAAMDRLSATGTVADAQNALQALDTVEQYLTQEQGYSKITSDVKNLVDGKTTLDEFSIQQGLNDVQANRLITADIIRKANTANIQSQSRRQLTAGSENRAGLGG
jgi:hypothetical protein